MVMPEQDTRSDGRGNELTVEVYDNLDEVGDIWRVFERDALGGPHDTWEWNQAWARTAGKSCKPMIVVGRTISGDTLFLLPLTIQKHLGCDVLEWLGASQGNYSSGLFHQTAWSQGNLPQGQELLRIILAALPHVDAVHLEKNPVNLGTQSAPLASLPSIDEASAGYKFPLSHDWETLYKERFSKNHRHNIRRCMRRLADEGDFTFKKIPHGPGRLAVLDAMLVEKKQWFAERGIANFHDDPDIREFFETLVQIPDQKDGLSAIVFCLSVDGKMIAANICLVFQNTLYGLITCTTYGPMRRHGPGRILFLRTVEHMAQLGIEAIDCGAGEDENKLRWCSEQRNRLHTLVPITAKGRLYVAALKAELLVKVQIKQSPQLWSLAKRMRQWTSVLRPSGEKNSASSGDTRLKA